MKVAYVFVLRTVFGVCLAACLENLALLKPTWLSSMDADVARSRPENVVAGTHGSSYSLKECCHTQPGDASPWVTVDLLGQYYVHNVTIYNRQDCCAERLNNFVIEVFKTNPTRCSTAHASVCKHYPSVFGSVETLVCNTPVLGRFVRVRKVNAIVTSDGDEILNICELEVYGSRQECLSSSYVSTPNQRLVSSAMFAQSASSITSCVVACELFRDCVGVNYNVDSGICELLTRPEPTDSISNHSDWVYSGNDLC